MLEWMIVSREIEICKGRGFGEKTVSEDWGSRVSNFQSAAARRMPTMLWHWHGSAGAHRFSLLPLMQISPTVWQPFSHIEAL
jgi:hypothetical protein